MQGRQSRGHYQPLFLFATVQMKETTADDRPDGWRRLQTPLARLQGKGSGTVRIIGIKKVQRDTRRHWETRTEVYIS